MKVDKVYCVINIKFSDGVTLGFSKEFGADIDTVALVVDNEPSPLDMFTQDEIAAAEEIAKNEYRKRNI